MCQPSSKSEMAKVTLFEAYCITTIKNYYKNCLRKKARDREKVEKLKAAILNSDETDFVTYDHYPAERHVFRVEDFEIWIEDWMLGEAMEHLSEQARQIIILKYFREMKDAEIAKYLKYSRRKTVTEKRMEALSELRKYMEKHSNE